MSRKTQACDQRQEALDGKVIVRMEKVTDEQYLAGPRARKEIRA